MADAPDLSTVVNMIMENPELVAKIAAMAKGKDETPEISEPATEASAPVSIAAESGGNDRRIHRARLASAMKPYLSPERAQAIDTMMSIADILELSRRKS